MAEFGLISETVGMVISGGVTFATHFIKTGTRALTSVLNQSVIGRLFTEDVAVFTDMWAAINHPAVWIVVATIIIILMVWLMLAKVILATHWHKKLLAKLAV
ncbi:DUF4126 domain-containing protein [Candidatus Ruthia endofausta]|nr:DUF4126 domain-containing protein [Candidatus Ruthia endofausta]